MLGIFIFFMVGVPALAGLQAPSHANMYDKEFFQQHRQHAAVYPVLVDVMTGSIGSSMVTHPPSMSVLDVGCGHGLLVEAWRTAGVAKSFCMEGSSEASHMWPDNYSEFYTVQNLEDDRALDIVPPTDVVTSFEVAEHLQPAFAEHFVTLLTLHAPQVVFFSAATPFQDRGMNPSHVNENTFQYWIQLFEARNYHVDWAATAHVKHALVTFPDPAARRAVMSAWWYPKNILVFRPNASRTQTTAALAAHPAHADMLSPFYLQLGGEGEFGTMWDRDWRSFGTLFYEAHAAAVLDHAYTEI